MRRRNWTVPYALFLLVFVIVPLLLIVLYAFTDDGGAFTLANFRKFMMHPEAMNTFCLLHRNSRYHYADLPAAGLSGGVYPESEAISTPRAPWWCLFILPCG